MKSSTELIAMAREIIKKELERSIEREKEPYYTNCVYEAYMQGLEDASGIDKGILKKAQDWHYVNIEGNPDDDDQYWVLYEWGYDGYKDTTTGYCEDGKWHLHDEPYGHHCKVIAWHPLPTYED